MTDANGWLVPTGDQAFLWSALYGAAAGHSPIDLTVVESEPGKFRICPACIEGPAGDITWSDWSRLEANVLLAYIWTNRDKELLARHIAYGVKSNWQMGAPAGDFRGVYTPAIVGRLYQTQYALAGIEDARRFWPERYPGDLDAYDAFQQVMNIWHRVQVSRAIADKRERIARDLPDDAGFDLDNMMLSRLQEHYTKDPANPLFAMALGRFTGDLNPAIDACLDHEGYAGSYVTCGEACRLAAWLFACGQTLEASGAKP
jgi:hypothetical protein